MTHLAICLTCKKLLRLTDAAFKLIRKSDIPGLRLLDRYMHCCAEPNYYWEVYSEKVTVKDIQKLLKRHEREAKKDA